MNFTHTNQERTLLNPEGHNVMLNKIAFNQDYSCFVAATTWGFRVFSDTQKNNMQQDDVAGNSVPKVQEIVRRENRLLSSGLQQQGSHQVEALGSIAIVTMLFQTNMFALVTTTEPTKCVLWDDQKQNFVGELRCRHEIKGVEMRRDVLALVTEQVLYLYETEHLKVIMHMPTASNPHGLCAIAPGAEPWAVCCPGKTTGSVVVQFGVEAIDEQTGKTIVKGDVTSSTPIDAHQSSIKAITMNSNGTLVSTASEKGTQIKVFDTATGEQKFLFKRGTTPAVISSLAFRKDDKSLAVASKQPTIHIFHLSDANSIDQNHYAQGTIENNAGDVNQNNLGIENLQQAASADGVKKIFTWATSKAAEVVQKGTQEMIKQSIPDQLKQRLNEQRSCWQYHMNEEENSDSMSCRSPKAEIHGPEVAFHPGDSSMLRIVHHNGNCHYVRFDEHLRAAPNILMNNLPGDKSKTTSLEHTDTWFQKRYEFSISKPRDDGDYELV